MNILDQCLLKRFKAVTPMEFYREIFPVGELDKKDAFTKGKYTGIIVSIARKDGKDIVHKEIVTDDLEAIAKVTQTDDFSICSPISYAGRKRISECARKLYAVAIDLDRIKPEDYEGSPLGLLNLLHQVDNHYLPRPTYIVSSGTGLHLYYVLSTPIPLYDNIARDLQDAKKDLTKMIWNSDVVSIKDESEVQYEGIYQGFRMPGTVTKAGGRATAYLTGEKVDIEYLESFIQTRMPQAKRKQRDIQRKVVKLEEAKERWPDWYERRVVKGEPKGVWHTNRRVYEWWKQQIISGAVEGHRYYCLMILAMYGKKCSYYDKKHNPNPVTIEEVEKDCIEMVALLDSRTVTDHFTKDDALKAMEAYNDRWTTYPIKTIQFRSGIRIEKNKRNGQRQRDHLEEARAIQEIRCRRSKKDWREGNGRKSKEVDVIKWRLDHPTGTKADCIRETGLSKPTVYKYWNLKKLNKEDIIEKIDSAAKYNIQKLEEIERRLLVLAVSEIKEQCDIEEVKVQDNRHLMIKVHFHQKMIANGYWYNDSHFLLRETVDPERMELTCTDQKVITIIRKMIENDIIDRQKELKKLQQDAENEK